MTCSESDDRYTLKCYGDFWQRDLGILTPEEAEALYELSMWFNTDILAIDIPGSRPGFCGYRIVTSRRFTHNKSKYYHLLVKI